MVLRKVPPGLVAAYHLRGGQRGACEGEFEAHQTETPKKLVMLRESGGSSTLRLLDLIIAASVTGGASGQAGR